MRLLLSLIVACFLEFSAAKTSPVIQSKEAKQIWRLDSFSKELFWEEPPEGLYEVDVGLRSTEGEQGNYPMSFSDLNNDKYTDIITVNDEKTSFTIHIFDPVKKMFLYQKTFKPNDCNKIANLVVGRSIDQIRLFLTCTQVTDTTVIKIYDKIKNFEFQDSQIKIPIEHGSQPFIADFNGDYLEDIMFTNTNKTLMVAFQMRNPEEFHLKDFESSLTVTDETEGCLARKSGVRKLTTPHSSSLIDFDGDCLSDLFITITDQATGKSYYEIYLRREKEQVDDQLNEDASIANESASALKGLNSFCLVAREEIPSQTNNLFYFADVDRDAMVDMLYISKSDLSLYVYYNKLLNQQNSAANIQQPAAFGIKQLCADTNRAISKIKDIYSSFSQIEEKYVVKQLISKDSNAVDLYSEDDKSMPGRLHIGDITSDGFPDILITMKYINGTTKSHILVNSLCDSTVCSSKAVKGKRRSFSLQYNQYQALLDQFDKVRYSVFFDLNENSMMDILLVKGSSADISAIYNNFGKDAFFLKTRVISDDTIGTTVTSASFRCVLTDLQDQKFIVMGGQSGQSSHQSLEMPFALIGIGRSNNFIESFTVSQAINGTRNMRMWTPIIPKSVLFVVTNNNNEPESWTLDILIKPNEKMVMILLVDAVFLCVLGLIIIVLHLLEKAEDRKEKQLSVLF